MAGALKSPTPKGRVKLEVAKDEQQPSPPKVASQTAAPNERLEQAILTADAIEQQSAADALSADVDSKDEKKGKTRATVVKVVKDIASAADPRPSRAIPKAEEWEPYVKRGLVYLSVFYVWWLTTDDDGDEIGDKAEFELDDERAELIGTPFARLWARTPLNRRYGRDLIENMDSVVALVALVTYVMDTRPLWRAKRQRELRRRGENPDAKVIDIRRAKTTTASARREPQPLEKPENSNGGTQLQDDQSKPEITGPYSRPLPFTPGEQHHTD